MKKTPTKPSGAAAAASKKKVPGKNIPSASPQISPKLAAIKRALNDGSFNVDSEVVADQLIGDSRQTLRRPVKKH